MSNLLANPTVDSCSAQVRITSAPGTIWISSPDRLSDCDETTYRRFIERVLTVDAVRSVDVNRSTGGVIVQYDRRALRQGEAMTRISGALNRTSDVQVDGIDLELIAGRVTRVERRSAGAGALTTIFSTGSDFLAACTRVVRRRSRDTASQRPRSAAESVIVGHGLAIHYEPESGSAPHLELYDPEGAAALVNLPVAGELTAGAHEITVATGFKRLLHLTAAGGCFFMSFVGLITPGIPTVPFVLATSYFLVRSSPTLNERLRKSRLFGQMVRDWESHGGLRRSTKRRVVWFTLILAGITLIVAEITLPLLLLIAVMGTLGTTLVLRLPTVDETTEVAADPQPVD